MNAFHRRAQFWASAAQKLQVESPAAENYFFQGAIETASSKSTRPTIIPAQRGE